MSDEAVWFWTILVLVLGWIDGGNAVKETRAGIRKPAAESSSLFHFFFGENSE